MTIDMGLLTSPIIACFAVLVLAEYLGMRKVAERGFSYIAAGAILLLLSGVTSAALSDIGAFGISTAFVTTIAAIFSVLGALAVLVGAILATLALLQD